MNPSYISWGISALLTINLTVAHSQYVWQRSPDNPIIPVWAGGDYSLCPSVLFDSASNAYRMWFTGKSVGNPWDISSAISDNGTDWYSLIKNPVLIGGQGAFDAGGVAHPSVIRDGSGYKMYYEAVSNAGVSQIGLATSSDGIHWTKYSGNPIIRVVSGSWESQVCAGNKVVYDGTSYKMLYRGYDGTNHRIGFATSSDGFIWTKHPANPVLQAGPTGGWDQRGALTNSLMVFQGVMYLFYQGSHPISTAIGLATSTDGVTWNRYPGNPIFSAGVQSWESRIDLGSILLKNGQLHLWYSGYTFFWQIGYATSPFTPLDVPEPKSVLPREFSLSQAYPNPFNPETTIEYSLPKETLVTIKVFDAIGQEVTTLVDQFLVAGAHSVKWNSAGAATGVYWYRMTAGSFSETKKIVLMK